MRILIVTAVEAEADAVRRGLTATSGTGTEVTAAGVGAAAAAAATSRQLALAAASGQPYQAVVSAGIAGGFPDRIGLGQTAVATRSIAADLGAQSPDGFLTLDELGFGSTVAATDDPLTGWLRSGLPEAVPGAVLTVNTVTGSASRATALADRYPDAVAEAMEGYGVACAAALAGLPFAELRTISNPVGPRDRAGWRIPQALAALTAAVDRLPWRAWP
ncbi:futalosine hydrolase [Micromonospora sp. NBC_01813]|uniref:futalosine hydrolase n=1 Tax=Micromonospora sp. NBC_01813 TaxID=2975988 RepID=UPI002DDB93FB|nr:futalosine hydrolase [Micromonospora sp. NBC_01813]WSA08036.1 futalosine hydrolase [Micromonospora sp. NBC_01813]